MRLPIGLTLLALLANCLGCGNGQPAPQEAATSKAPSPGVASEPLLESEASERLPVLDDRPVAATELRRQAADAAFQELVRAGTQVDPAAWPLAEERLRELGVDAVPSLAAGLASADRRTREFAAMFLAQLGPEAEGAAPALLGVLRDESPFVRVNAVSSLSYFPQYAMNLVPVCTELLALPDANVQITAAIALSNLGEAGKSAIPSLRNALGSSDARVRQAAATALGHIGPAAAAAVPDLRALASANDPDLRATAVEAIRSIESPSRPSNAVPDTVPAGFELPQLSAPVLE